MRRLIVAVAALVLALAFTSQTSSAAISFTKSQLAIPVPDVTPNVTSLQFGPDGRLYVSDQHGDINVYTVVRNGPDDYDVTATENIKLIDGIPNHNDDGSLNTNINDRQITGILVTGTAANPVIYVTSSDPRIGAGPSGNDLNLDTNSGILSRLTWTGAAWTKVDLVRGLPRSEENHSSNGMQLDATTNTLYIAQGGNTNKGAPSNNFALLPEYALSAAILSVDLDAIGSTTYDLPTLDDDTRPGNPDANDPFGGNDGKNQAILVPGGPVQVYAPGFRNPYDLVITESGRMYTVDNGPNSGWGAPPFNEGPSGVCTNAVQEPGTTYGDGLHYVTGPGYYGGHPNPTRANTANTFNSPPQSPVSTANPVECDYRIPGVEDGALHVFSSSTNGITEYTASNFGGEMQGDLVMASFNDTIYRVKLNAAGTATTLVQPLFSNVDNVPLDVIAQGDDDPFPGTIWTGDIFTGRIWVFEPAAGSECSGAYDPALDEDNDGFDNADEIDNGTNPCSAADVPPDWDGDFTSDLNDPDDDNDGLPDTSDPFALDPNNGNTTTLPVSYTWNNDALSAGGLLNLGFTGLMTNGVSDYADLFDPTAMTAGGAAGVTTVDAVPDGDALGASNNQEYGLQFGVDAPASTFTARTRIQAPFAGLTPQDSQSMGLFIGNGDQDNYVKVVTNANGGGGGVNTLKEIGGTVTAGGQAALALPGPSHVDLFLTVDPATNTVQASYQATTGGVTGARTNVGGAQAIPAGWLTGVTGLAVGIISTSAGPAPPFPATWDRIDVFAGVDPPNHSAFFKAEDTSTYSTGSMVFTNTSTGSNIESVSIDFATAVMWDLVWDPDDGTPAGDPVNKDLTIDDETGDGVGVVSDETADVFSDPFQNGYLKLTIEFTDFEPGETVSFSADVDPTAIQGANQSGPGEVVGSELIGSTITVNYADGASHTSTLNWDPDDDQASIAVLNDDLPSRPTLSWDASTPALVTDADQQITITGTPNAAYTMTIVEGVMDIAGHPGAGFDVDPYETTRFVQGYSLGTSGEPDTWRSYTGTLNGAGQATVNVVLTDSGAVVDGTILNAGVNHIVAFLHNTAGDPGGQSNEIRLDYDADAVPDTTPPLPPTNLIATPGDNQVALSWTASTSSDTAGYNVYRSTTTSPVSTATVPLNGTTLVSNTAYVDNTAPNGTEFFYVVTAVDGSANESGSSNEASATPAVSAGPAPVALIFDGGAGGLQDTGFTGVLPNSGGTQYDDSLVALSAPSSYLSITSTTGDMYQGDNNQNNALMIPADTSQPFTVQTRLLPPFGNAQNWDAAGIWAGVDQDNYVKLVNTYNGGPAQIELMTEIAGATSKAQQGIGTPWASITSLDLRLVVDPIADTASGYIRVNSSDAAAWTLIGTVAFASSQSSPSGAAGVLTTHVGNTSAITQRFDHFYLNAADSDSDEVLDAADNCPTTPNKDQANADGDAWGDACDFCPTTATPWFVPAGDSDCDGFTDAVEAFVGTDPNVACALTSTANDEADDRWPADINDDQAANILDVIMLTPPVFNSAPPNPNYSQRRDLNADGAINILDILQLAPPLFNNTCS